MMKKLVDLFKHINANLQLNAVYDYFICNDIFDYKLRVTSANTRVAQTAAPIQSILLMMTVLEPCSGERCWRILSFIEVFASHFFPSACRVYCPLVSALAFALAFAPAFDFLTLMASFASVVRVTFVFLRRSSARA